MRWLRTVLIHNILITNLFFLFFLSTCTKNDAPTQSNDPPEEKYDPIAEFSASPTSGEAPLTVSFNAGASSDQDGDIVKYSWTYGDGSANGQGMTTQHTYSEDGSFTARLTVTDNDDKTATKSKQITVTKPPGPTLFPMYAGAQWAYNVKVYYKALTKNTGATEYGKVTATITEYNEETLLAKLKVAGDVEYFSENYQPITVPEEVYIRETTTGLERAESASGPWEKTIQSSGIPWYNGGLIFAGSTSRQFTSSQSSMSVTAGTFSGTFVRAYEDNWGEPYTTDDHEFSWRELFNPDYGLVWSKYYYYYDDKSDMYGPTIISKELELTGYAIPLPDGSVRRGGSGASIQVTVTCEPGIIYESGTPPEVSDKFTPVHLRFTLNMNHSSVESLFSVGLSQRLDYPPHVYNHSGTIAWDGDKHLIWTPTEKLEDSPFLSNYVFVKLEQGAQSTTGDQLSETLIFVFEVK